MLSHLMFHGWKIVGVSILTQAVQAGLLVYSIGVLALSFETEFGGPRKDVMLAATCLSIATSLISPLGGIAIDRFSAKRLMLGGVTALSLGFIVLGQARSLVQVWLVFGVVLRRDWTMLSRSVELEPSALDVKISIAVGATRPCFR